MRKNIVALLAIGFVGLAGPALADSANGSTEHDGTEFTNQVTCGEVGADDVDGPLANVYVTGDPATQSGGAEVCADGSDDVPTVEGRVIAEGGTDGGFVAIDGDETNVDNSGNEQSGGWARVDVSDKGAGVRCGDSEGNLDATHPTGDDTQEDCDPTAG